MRKTNQWYVHRRITCKGYPSSESRFDSVEEYAEFLEAKLDAIAEKSHCADWQLRGDPPTKY